MPIDAKRLCHDFNIPFTENGKHSRKGWVNINCPLCSGNPGKHGGLNSGDPKFKGLYHCWRCGWHWAPKVLSVLLKTDLPKAKKILDKNSNRYLRPLCCGFRRRIPRQTPRKPNPIRHEIPNVSRWLQKVLSVHVGQLL